MNCYQDVKKALAKGWNTWNTRSVLSHVLLLQGLTVNLALKEYKQGLYLKEALIGKFSENDEKIHPGPHAYDGSYTELNLKWHSIEMTVQSAACGEDLVILVTPVTNQVYPATLVVELGMLWNRPGTLSTNGDRMIASFEGKTINLYTTQKPIGENNIPPQPPYIALKLDRAIGISTGKKLSVEEIKSIL